MGDKIKDVYNISFNIADIPNADRSPMHDWYNGLINKTYAQLDLFDVTRMLIQKVFLELAVSKALDFIEEDAFCGQRYDGELMELLSKLDLDYLEGYKNDITKILSKALVDNKTREWLCQEDKAEFSELIDAFQRKLQS